MAAKKSTRTTRVRSTRINSPKDKEAQLAQLADTARAVAIQLEASAEISSRDAWRELARGSARALKKAVSRLARG